jgi:LacI family transcriptional regulator
MPKNSPAFPTIMDVARLARVSIATVSGVANGRRTASAEVQRRVEEAMKALDYHADHLARSLKTGRSRVIGMIIPDLANPFFVEVMCGVEETARNAGYSMIFSNSNENPAQERENLAMLYSQRVGGVVLACSDGHAAYDRLTARRFPIVFVDRLPVTGYCGRAVIVDNIGAAYDATRHLIELGHADIALIAGRTDLSVGIGRIEGFRKAMQEAHLPIREAYFRQGDFSWESGHRCGLELLSLPEPPTAIFSCNNKMTLGLMRALTECGAKCPEYVSVLAFDDFAWTSNFAPQLTAVAQPSHEMGRRAVQLLLSTMDSETELTEQLGETAVVLKAELRVRQSTAPPRR